MNKLIFEREITLIGDASFKKLNNSKICLAGVGGVGSYVAEALVRSGIGKIILIDYDKIEISNINRQLHALNSTVGQYKVEAMKARLLDINPELNIQIYKEKINDDFLYNSIDDQGITYIIDAIDDVQGKISLIKFAKMKNIPVISCMGTANKIDNKTFKVVDISKTNVCPLARKMRYSLKKEGIIRGVKVVYSETISKKSDGVLGTIAFVPGTAALLLTSEVVCDIINEAVYSR